MAHNDSVIRIRDGNLYQNITLRFAVKNYYAIIYKTRFKRPTKKKSDCLKVYML